MSDKPGEFADHPESIGEIKANRECDMRLWKPRDVLIDLLRRIDRGEVASDAMIIVYRRTEGDDTFTSFGMACPDLHTALGLLSRAAYQMNER